MSRYLENWEKSRNLKIDPKSQRIWKLTKNSVKGQGISFSHLSGNPDYNPNLIRWLHISIPGAKCNIVSSFCNFMKSKWLLYFLSKKLSNFSRNVSFISVNLRRNEKEDYIKSWSIFLLAKSVYCFFFFFLVTLKNFCFF